MLTYTLTYMLYELYIIIIINNVVYIQKLNRCVNDRDCYNRQFKLSTSTRYRRVKIDGANKHITLLLVKIEN